ESSGRPAQGSSEVIFTRSSAPRIRRSRPSREKSLEYVLAARFPAKTRSPMPREPASFKVSTSPMRTTVENSAPSRTTASAAVAPPLIARATTSAASSRRSISALLKISVLAGIQVLTCRSANGHLIELQRGDSNTDRDGLAIFAAGAHAFIELQIVPHHGDFSKSVRAVADQRAV